MNQGMRTYHLFFPPRTVRGIPLKINKAPNTPYAGSMMMLNGTQSSPSCHSTVPLVVPFAKVALPFRVALAMVSLSDGEVELSVRVRVNGTADDWPDA